MGKKIKCLPADGNGSKTVKVRVIKNFRPKGMDIRFILVERSKALVL
jgi:hypothetical protein